jgi:hypothetical protein
MVASISVKLKFGVEWAQKDPAKIMISVPVKVRISKDPGFMFPINLNLFTDMKLASGVA